MKDIWIQIVEAMRFIPSRGLCHGDFHPDNIVFRLTDGVEEWEGKALMKILGEVERIPVRSLDGRERGLEPSVPAYLVLRASIDYGSALCSTNIAVIDFGVSYHASQSPVGIGTFVPLPYAGPDDVFDQDRSMGFPTDIWALKCTITKVRHGFVPFASEYDGVLTAVRKMEAIMGPMPNPYRTMWKNWGYRFVNCEDAEGNLRDDDSEKDESVYASLQTGRQQQIREERVREVGRLKPLGIPDAPHPRHDHRP